MILKEEVKRIVKLARLGLSDSEVEKFQKELSAILDYIEKMKEVDVFGIEAESHTIKVENVMRKDEARSFGKEKELMELAPETKDGYLKVKSVF